MPLHKLRAGQDDEGNHTVVFVDWYLMSAEGFVEMEFNHQGWEVVLDPFTGFILSNDIWIFIFHNKGWMSIKNLSNDLDFYSWIKVICRVLSPDSHVSYWRSKEGNAVGAIFSPTAFFHLSIWVIHLYVSSVRLCINGVGLRINLPTCHVCGLMFWVEMNVTLVQIQSIEIWHKLISVFANEKIVIASRGSVPK